MKPQYLELESILISNPRNMYHIFDRSTFEFHEFPGKIMKYKSFLHQKTTEHSKSLQNIFAFNMIISV